jgi:hypothetical protein
MRTAKYHKEIEALLNEGRELTTEDFVRACPGMPMPSVYSRIRGLVVSGKLTRTGQGRYFPVHKPSYPYSITPWMRDVCSFLEEKCVGINFCLCQKGANLFIDAQKSDLHIIEHSLKQNYSKVVWEKDAKALLPQLEGYIVIGPIVTDAPFIIEQGVPVPAIEKELVDLLAKKNESEINVKNYFQRVMEVYPVNKSRLRRYASRRGLTEELSARLASLDNSRISMFSDVQKYLAKTAITKAWVFGSFARGEETPESDLDLLVDYDKDVQISLLEIVRNKLDLETITHREVDLITNGSLKPFAVESANRDKYLIYER